MSLSYAEQLDRSSRRLDIKTRDGLFHHALSTEFNFSPRECSGVLDLLNDLYFGVRPLNEGQVRQIAVHKEERSGKRMDELRKVEVVLTRESSDDKKLRSSSAELRRVQILRMTEEAYEQDGLLTQEDLSRLLGLSVRQVRRDIKALVDKGYRVLLRGRMQDIGRGVSHKVWIVNLYLEWKTYSEIRRITGHTVDAIKKYLNDFSRILMNVVHGVGDVRQISFYTGKSPRLVQEYLDIIKAAKRDEMKQRKLESMKEQLRWLRRRQVVDFKKSHSCMVWRLI